MKIAKCCLCAVIAAAAGIVGAEPLNRAADWQPKSASVEKDGGLLFKKKTMLNGKKFKVDPAKQYTFKYKVTVSNDQNKKGSWMLGGFQLYDANNKIIRCVEVNAFPGTYTEVAADAAQGATEIIVKDGSRFRVHVSSSIAVNAKADFSDLPNRDILPVSVKKVEKAGENWKITLNAPIKKELKAGTFIREHIAGGYFYAAGSSVTKDEKVYTAQLRGVAKSASWSGNVWPAGTAYAMPLLLINWRNDKVDTFLSDIEFTVE